MSCLKPHYAPLPLPLGPIILAATIAIASLVHGDAGLSPGVPDLSATRILQIFTHPGTVS